MLVPTKFRYPRPHWLHNRLDQGLSNYIIVINFRQEFSILWQELIATFIANGYAGWAGRVYFGPKVGQVLHIFKKIGNAGSKAAGGIVGRKTTATSSLGSRAIKSFLYHPLSASSFFITGFNLF